MFLNTACSVDQGVLDNAVGGIVLGEGAGLRIELGNCDPIIVAVEGTGDLGRIVASNDWVRPRLTDFQDFEFGGGFDGLNNGAVRLLLNGAPCRK